MAKTKLRPISGRQLAENDAAKSCSLETYRPSVPSARVGMGSASSRLAMKVPLG
jgi:hypothetical protein